VNLWQMERLRLSRTGRWIPVVAAYAFFGVLGPVSVRYASAIIKRVGTGGATITFPPAVPSDGIQAFVKNAQQIGLLATVIIAAGALAFDAHPTISTFLRTRVRPMGAIILPKYTWSTAVAITGFAAGAAAAWALTSALLGALPVAGMLEGIALFWLYLAFAVAVVALAATLASTQLSTVLVALVTLLALPIMGLVRGVEPWLPSHLAGALNGLVIGTSFASNLRSAAVTILAIPLALWGVARLAARREL
jgi:ABC-2 type transport system permease protein